MNDRAFIKLFSGIVTSSIWNQESDHRVVWITMLALANSHGQVLSTLGALARIANVPPEVCQAAVESFLAPDADSRTKDDDGRRIRVIDGGWELVNYELYRQMLSDEERREYQAEYYLKRKQAKDLRGVNNRQHSSSLSREAEAEAEGEGEGSRARKGGFAKPTLEELKLAMAKAGLPEAEAQKFLNHYESNGWRVGKNPMRSWQHAVGTWTANYRQFQPAQAKPPPKDPMRCGFHPTTP